MKKLLSILLVSVIFSCFNGDKRYHIDEVVSPPNNTLRYHKKDMSLLNGVVYCEFGELGKFIEGKREGIQKNWYTNGQLKYTVNCKDGKKDGLSKGWWENGQLRWELNYKEDKEEGLSRSWGRDGQLRTEGNFKDGKRDGEHKQWYENGQLEEEVNYIDGREVSRRTWTRNGEEMSLNHLSDEEIRNILTH